MEKCYPGTDYVGLGFYCDFDGDYIFDKWRTNTPTSNKYWPVPFTNMPVKLYPLPYSAEYHFFSMKGEKTDAIGWYGVNPF